MSLDWRKSLALGGAAVAGVALAAWLRRGRAPGPLSRGATKRKPAWDLRGELGAYLHNVALRLHPVQQKVIDYTASVPRSGMLSSSDQIQLLQHMIKYSGYKKCIDVGVFTGYSSLSFALAIPDDGVVMACELSEELLRVAEGFWKEAGVNHKVHQHQGPAARSLQQLLERDGTESYDLVYIDADKRSYCEYYQLARQLVRKGGVIAVDNVIWRGSVADESVQDDDTCAIRALNQLISDDTGVDISLLTVGDGLFLAWVK